MATLYVENVPDGLYEALRRRAREHRKSMAAEVLSLLEENVPTALELESRKEFYHRVLRFRARKPRARGPMISSEELQREDRSR